ncbi:MAG: hypothetical protein PHD65_02575 [Gallionella sp.]|nr:hypothetical protein [Gallionella sp.]
MLFYILQLIALCFSILLTIYFLNNRVLKEKPNWGLIIPSIIVILGWLVGYHMETSRDLENKRREQRVEMLTKAFQSLAKAYNHDPSDVKEDVQSALIAVQLLGSQTQAERIKFFVKRIENKEGWSWSDYDKIVEDLRNDLRHELDLPEIKDKVWWIRIEKPQETPNKLSQPNGMGVPANTNIARSQAKQ